MRLSRRDKRARQGEGEVRIANLLRRMSVGDTAALEYVLEGLEDADGNLETDRGEVFGVAGVASRPAAGDKAEAVVAYLGGDANAPVVVATRNADAIRRLEAALGRELGAGETAVFSSSAGARITLDGDTVTIVSEGNPAAEPTYKVETHDLLFQALINGIASAAALTGAPATTAVQAALQTYNAGLAAAKTGSQIS